MMRRTTVLIADDHAIVSEGLAALLTKHDFEVVGTVRDGQALLDAAKRLHPEVIVTDLSMPGLSGLDVLARLKACTGARRATIRVDDGPQKLRWSWASS